MCHEEEKIKNSGSRREAKARLKTFAPEAFDVGRPAMVGAPLRVDWCVKLSTVLFKGDVRTFDAGATDTAWA